MMDLIDESWVSFKPYASLHCKGTLILSVIGSFTALTADALANSGSDTQLLLPLK